MVNVEFEPGIHVLTETQILDAAESWLNGKPDFLWHIAGAERVASSRPSALAVDSMTNFYNAKMDAIQKVEVAMLMPEQPRFLNGTDNIQAIAGDVLRSHPEPHDNAMWYRVGNAAVVLAAAAYAGKKVGERIDQQIFEHDMVEAQNKISRRQFLGRAALYTGAAAFLVSELAAFTPYKFLQSFARTAEEYADPLEVHLELSGLDTFVDGRTAMLIEKTDHASDNIYAGEKLPLLLGATHNHNANNLLRSKSARYEAITEFAHAIVEKEGRAKRNAIITDISTYQVINVSQMDEAKLKENVLVEVGEKVRHLGQITINEIAHHLDEKLPSTPRRAGAIEA